jgi:hypothetical protein
MIHVESLPAFCFKHLPTKALQLFQSKKKKLSTCNCTEGIDTSHFFFIGPLWRDCGSSKNGSGSASSENSSSFGSSKKSSSSEAVVKNV